ncbi:hypothetical protein, partial [Streptomyces sp. NPDC048720]|uniref:hypothetical protein n=1 Tax=Streptomyces sp. NPDC048720 TaxID=3365588 RepID=UPI00371133DE
DCVVSEPDWSEPDASEPDWSPPLSSCLDVALEALGAAIATVVPVETVNATAKHEAPTHFLMRRRAMLVMTIPSTMQ